MEGNLTDEYSRCLPHTSRVNEEILNYYLQYGRDRDLEKFMRLYSPASTSSENSTCSENNTGMFHRLFNLNESTNIGTELKEHDKSKENKKCDFNKNIPIVILNNKVKVQAVSCEDLQTPEKSKLMENEVRTPESITKSNRRLEWDSLGDVGYKKSMSTSNISMLERSLLKELFQTSINTNASDTDINKFKPNLQTQVTGNNIPLASSTFTDSNICLKTKRDANHKFDSESTNTTELFQKIYDNSSQTSLKYPITKMQESLSPRNGASSSVACSTVTPSSFEYYSSKSSLKSGSNSSVNSSKSCESILQNQNNKFETESFQQNEEHLQKQISTNNKNITSSTIPSSTISHSPQLDLGVQLLCALIEAKSLNVNEKKHLIRDIITRISCLDIINEDDETFKENINISLEQQREISKTIKQKTQLVKNHSIDKKAMDLDLKGIAKIKNSKNTIHNEDYINNTKKQDDHTNTDNNVPKASDKSSSISNSSQEQITLKAINASAQEDISMGEWLNPITQSEIQYEEQGELSCTNDFMNNTLRPDNECDVQIHWIETEIKRLERLRNLLAQENKKLKKTPLTSNKVTNHISTAEHKKKKEICSRNIITGNSSPYKLYSIVVNHPIESTKKILKINQEKTKTTTAGMKRGVKDIANNKQNNTSYTQTTLSKDLPTQPLEQRSKIDTPSDSIESISVCSFVRQRKSEFIEHYRNKKFFLQEQRKLKQYFKAQPTPGSYSVPEKSQINNHYSLPNTIKASQNHIKCHKGHSHAKFTSNKPNLIEIVSFHNERNAYDRKTNVSSISTLYSSSEMSVPMGSLNSSTSLGSTTHNNTYDDVAATVMLGVDVQTSDSMLHIKPIFSPNHNTTVLPSNIRVIQSSNCVPAGVKVKPKSIAYVITFDQESITQEHIGIDSKISSSIEEQSSPLTLQDYLERARPDFCVNSNERLIILHEMQALRQERGKKIQKLLENVSFSSLDKTIDRLPPPPTSYLRIFPTKYMKSMTNKKFSKLPEVLEKKERYKEECRRRNNRILRDLFNKRLQNLVRTGKLSLNHSKTVI